jgi:hypothetical protein
MLNIFKRDSKKDKVSRKEEKEILTKALKESKNEK